MHPAPYEQQYERLRSEGMTPLGAALAICRANSKHFSFLLYWLSTKNPEQLILRRRCLQRETLANKERLSLVGYNDAGCYYYSSLCRRPQHTDFIRWQDIESIYIQDGQEPLAVAICSSGSYGFQAQNDMLGFAPFVEEISRRFFGSSEYLARKFTLNGHSVRKFRVWPDEENVEPGAAPNGGPTTQSRNSKVTEGPPSVS